jgi:GNAT superfamily N-acetyltransferase
VSLHTWWRGDGRPPLPRPFGFAVAPTEDRALVAALADLDRAEVDDRVRAGHRPYVARLRGTPVAYGWSAPHRAAMGELGLEFAIPAGARYLWDFATLPAWRGLGLYPALLQAILARESGEADRFWIGHLVGNTASGKGIRKAGFREVGRLEASAGGRLTLASARPADRRARAAAAMFGAELAGA